MPIKVIMQGEREKPVVVSDIGQTLADGGLRYFREFRGRYDPSNPVSMVIVYDAFQPLPNAQSGFRRLTSTYRLGGYYTVRPPELKAQATNWLTRSSFPDPENVHVCRDYEDKVRQVIRDILAPQPSARVILIDDNAERLVEVAAKMIEKNPQLADQMERLAIVALSEEKPVDNLPLGIQHPKTGIHLFHLKSWEEHEIEDLVTTLTRAGF